MKPHCISKSMQYTHTQLITVNAIHARAIHTTVTTCAHTRILYTWTNA